MVEFSVQREVCSFSGSDFVGVGLVDVGLRESILVL